MSVPASCSLSVRDEEVSHSTGNTTDMSDASMHLCLGVFLVHLGLNADIENIIQRDEELECFVFFFLQTDWVHICEHVLKLACYVYLNSFYF